MSSYDGLPEVASGTVSCEVEGSGKSESIGDSVKDWLGLGKKKDQEPLSDEDDAGPTEDVEATTSSSAVDGESATSSSSSSSSTSAVPEKPKKRTESINLALTVTPRGNPQPAPDMLKQMRERLLDFDRSDRARLAREEASNVLEAYTYYVRDFLENSDYAPFMTKDQSSEIRKLLTSAREFMDDSKQLASASKEVLIAKHDKLKQLVEPVQVRRKEDAARPEKLEGLKASLQQTEKLVDMIRAQVKQANDAKSKAEAFDATEGAASPSSAASDDLESLEEPDSATAGGDTENPLGPKYNKASDFAAYTDVDLKEVSDAYESVKSWLSEQEAAQAKLKQHDEPAFSIKDLEAKANELSQVMKDLLYKQMKAPPKSSSTKKAKSSKAKSSKKSKKTSSGSEEEATASSGEAAPRITINPGDDMPSEEDILSMVEEARASQSTSKHDEL